MASGALGRTPRPIAPPRLRRGDTVAVVATSSGLATVYPKVYRHGLRNMRELFGLDVKEYPTATMTSEELRRSPEARAADLNAAFADPDVKAIVATIGGDDSVRVLRHLDPEVAIRNPKILMGFSDTVTQLVFYNAHGLVTFHGPSVMAGFAQMGAVDGAVVSHVQTLLFSSFERYEYRPYGKWHDGYPDWSEDRNSDQVTPGRSDEGPRWLQGSGVHAGRLFGGCIEVLDFVRGTDFWPSGDVWDGRILFLETSEEAPSPMYVERWLRSAGAAGMFDRLRGLLFGRARDYSDEEKRQLDERIVGVVAGEFGAGALPVVTNLDFGHTDPQWILPVGGLLEIDCDRRALTLAECPTSG